MIVNGYVRNLGDPHTASDLTDGGEMWHKIGNESRQAIHSEGGMYAVRGSLNSP